MRIESRIESIRLARRGPPPLPTSLLRPHRCSANNGCVLSRLVPEPSGPSRSGASDPRDPIPTYGAEEERQDVRLWRTVVIGEQEHRINMKVIEPYMRVISHGGAGPAALGPENPGGKWGLKQKREKPSE